MEGGDGGASAVSGGGRLVLGGHRKVGMVEAQRWALFRRSRLLRES